MSPATSAEDDPVDPIVVAVFLIRANSRALQSGPRGSWGNTMTEPMESHVVNTIF